MNKNGKVGDRMRRIHVFVSVPLSYLNKLINVHETWNEHTVFARV
jgi:hypothetical protein